MTTARVFDPFPIPDHRGLSPTHAIDWAGIAQKIVREVLCMERHERVLISADPYFGGAALDALRQEIQRARAIELATILHWTPALTALRLPNGRATDPAHDAAELAAMRRLFAIADVFVLLMNDRRGTRRTLAGGQAETIVDDWPGRAVHLHWFHDPAIPDPAHPVNLALDRVNEAAVLDLDRNRLQRTMAGLARRLAGAAVRVTDPRGTDLTCRLGDRFHQNFGDASRARMALATSGRDREEELPAGSFRTIPVPGTAQGIIAFPPRRDGESPALGRGFDAGPFAAAGLTFRYARGAVIEVRTGGDQARLEALWAAETGDKGGIGELVLGCNPLLKRVRGSTFEPHYGFGAGVVRLILGDNTLSGGTLRSSFHRWIMLNDATVSVDGAPIVQRGELVVEE